MDDRDRVVVLFAIASASLVVLSVAYWYIMRQDGSILATAGGVIGGLLGYFIRYIRGGGGGESGGG